MTPKLRKTLKTATIAFAAIGIFLCIVIVLDVLHDRNKESELDADTLLLTNIYAGTGTRLGLVSRNVELDMGRTSVRHQLNRMLAHEESPDGKRQLLVIAYRDMRPEISTKIETGSVDIAKMAAAGTLDMLVDLQSTAWLMMASLREKKNGEWVEIASQRGITPGELSETPPIVRFPKLSKKVHGFSLFYKDDGEVFYQVQDKGFVTILDLTTTRIDDLDDCLSYRERTLKEEATRDENTASKTQDASSTPTSEEAEVAEVAEDEEDEHGMHDEIPDYWCIKASLRSRILPSMSNGYHEVEVLAEGEGAGRKPMSKRYVLRYMPRHTVYGFAEAPNHTPITNVMVDFAATLP